jgi:glycosyltransferase involved in cell wall biosynthesis
MAGKRGYKVLMTADTVGGVWTYAMELIRAFEPHGLEVHLATLGGPLSVSQQQDLEGFRNVTLYPSSFKLEWMENPWEDLKKAEEWLLLLNETVQPDIIHLNNLAFGHLDWGRPVVQVVHSCVLSWWKAVKGEEAPASWSGYKNLVQQSLLAADVVVAPTRAMLEEARSIYGFTGAQKVIHNGQVPSRFRYGNKEPFIFSMGRIWDEAKNLSSLAKVAPRLSWPVFIAGEAVHPDTGEAISLPNVHFLGQLSPDEVRDWLARAPIFVLPARYEPFGLAVLEAAMSGCALVVGKTKSLKEVWGHAAHYVCPDSPEQLQAALERLIADEFLRNIMSCRATRQSYAYTAKLMAQDYLRVYGDLSYKLQAASYKLQVLNGD